MYSAFLVLACMEIVHIPSTQNLNPRACLRSDFDMVTFGIFYLCEAKEFCGIAWLRNCLRNNIDMAQLVIVHTLERHRF